MDLAKGIYCNIHGDIPKFEIQCPDYEFSEKVKKKSEKQELKKTKKEGKRSKVIPIILSIGGFLRAAMKGFEDPFGIILFILGICWLIVLLSGNKKNQ